MSFDPSVHRARSARAAGAGGHLQVERSEQQGDVVLALTGELDLDSAPVLASVLRQPENADSARLVLDLSGLEFIDSTGISVLVQARQRAGELVLTDLPSSVDRLFTITGIKSQFTIT